MSVQRGVNALLGTRRLQAVAVPPGSSCRGGRGRGHPAALAIQPSHPTNPPASCQGKELPQS